MVGRQLAREGQCGGCSEGKDRHSQGLNEASEGLPVAP